MGRGLSADETSVRGVDLVLSRADSRPGHIVITGQFQGKILRWEFNSEEAKIRTTKYSNTLRPRGLHEGFTVYGPAGDLTLKGEAGREAPPWPQFGLALLAAFEGDAVDVQRH